MRRVDTATEELFRKFQINDRMERGKGNSMHYMHLDAFLYVN